MRRSDSQYLQSRDFVLQHLLSLVKISQHDVSFSVMDHSQLPQVSLVSLGKVLLVGPASEAPGSQTCALDNRLQRPAAISSQFLMCRFVAAHVPTHRTMRLL